MTQESPWKHFKDEKPEAGKPLWIQATLLESPFYTHDIDSRPPFAKYLRWCYAKPPPLPKPEPKCPWCGEKAVVGNFMGVPPTFYGRCIKSECLASGPVRSSEQEALDAFCSVEVKK